MYDIESEIIVCNSSKTKDIKDIDKAIEKLKQPEKKLVDLYLSSTLDVEAINHKNDVIKKEIENLNKKKQQIDPYDELKDYTVELLKKLDCNVENGEVISNNKLAFSFVFDSLNRQAKKELIKRLIDKIEIKRAKNYDVEIINIKFTEEFISKSSKTYIKYLDEILQNNNIGFIYKEAIDEQELEKLQKDYFIFSSKKIENEEYSQTDVERYIALLEEHFYKDGVVTYPYIEESNEFVLPHKFQYGVCTPYPKKIKTKGTKKIMNDDKVKYLIDMIRDMDIENKLRLAICMNDNYSHTNLEYDKKEMYKHFDLLLKEINIEYRTTLLNFANYPLIMFAMAKIMEMDSTEQNKVILYLFNSINYKIKKYVNVDKILDNHKQMF